MIIEAARLLENSNPETRKILADVFEDYGHEHAAKTIRKLSNRQKDFSYHVATKSKDLPEEIRAAISPRWREYIAFHDVGQDKFLEHFKDLPDDDSRVNVVVKSKWLSDQILKKAAKYIESPRKKREAALGLALRNKDNRVLRHYLNDWLDVWDVIQIASIIKTKKGL